MVRRPARFSTASLWSTLRAVLVVFSLAGRAIVGVRRTL